VKSLWRISPALCGLALFLAGHGAAFAQAKETNGILTGSNGMTLYFFEKDSAGKSTCNGPCATNWPPLMAADSDKTTGDYTVITRDDGKKQWAYKGKPLYFWAKDQKAGDTTGNGVGAWRTAKP